MKCDEVEYHLDPLLDKQLAPFEKEEIESHLESCTFCETAFRSLNTLSSAIRTDLISRAPVSLDEKVLQAFRHNQFVVKKESAEIRTGSRLAAWFAISRPALALVSLLLAATTLIAFQIGKWAAITDRKTDRQDIAKQVAGPDDPSLPQNLIDPANGGSHVSEPVAIKPDSERNEIDEDNNGQRRYPPSKKRLQELNRVKQSRARTEGHSTPVYSALNLDGFEPVAEMKIRVTKKENQK